MSPEVERISADSPSAADELLSKGDRPFLIPDSVDERTRSRRWSPSGLRSRVGAKEVSVTRSETEKFDFTPGGEPRYSYVGMPFAEALDLIAASRAPGPCYSLRRVELSALGLDGAGLARAVAFTRGTERTQNLWVTSDGSLTPLHYDTKNNLLTQMHGRREVTLFPSSEDERMYPTRLTARNFLSLVDPEAVDRGLFPDFPSELKLTVVLNPGDTLFIPPFWWHHVRSRDVSVSVNVFWLARPEQCLVPNSVDYLRTRYQKQWLREFFGSGGALRPSDFARLAAQAYERGLACAAALFCGVAAHLTLSELSADVGEPLLTPDAPTPDAGAAGPARALAERGVITAVEQRQAELWLLLAGFAARHGKAPNAAELERMLAGVSGFVSVHAARTKELSRAPVEVSD